MIELIVDEGDTKFYYKYGTIILHRLDGPAIEYANGIKLWYINGKQIDCTSQQQFEKLIKLKAFW